MRALLARVDAVLVQALIAAALSFAHLHDNAAAAGQDGWKAWAYPISVDLLLVAAWRRLRSGGAKASSWCWFVIALTASLGANVATAGLLDMTQVPAWLRILVAGWPAVAFLGGTLLAHSAPTTALDKDVHVVKGQEEAPESASEPPAQPAVEKAPRTSCRRGPDCTGRPCPQGRCRTPHPHRYTDRHANPSCPPRHSSSHGRSHRRPALKAGPVGRIYRFRNTRRVPTTAETISTSRQHVVITVAQDSPNHHLAPTHASPSTNAAEPKAASRRAPCDMPLIYARPRAPGKRTKERKPAVPANRRFRNVTRIGPVQVGTAYDHRGREKHTAACIAPRHALRQRLREPLHPPPAPQEGVPLGGR
jgi:hypothetical protein